MADQEQENQQPAGQQAAAAHVGDVKLPSFWPARPVAWFHLVESRFRLRRIVDETVMFDHLLSALPEDIIASILDVLETVGEQEEPYTALKERLLETHSLSSFEKLEQLLKMPVMGGRKPSQLLTAMLEMCPANEERTQIFMFLFLQRLPKDLRLMLGDVEAGDPRAVAAKADRLWACHAKQVHDSTVAAVAEALEEQEEEGAVAAVGGKQQRPNGRRKQFRKGGGGQQKAADGGQGGQAKEKTAPMDVAIAASGLCRAHWFHGERAKHCTPGSSCAWQGN